MVTVIVPIYNCEDKLERCVNSIQNQTYKDLEIILVNDGSKDKSGERCDCLAASDDRIIVVHKENGGVSSARNKGLELAKGEYIQFVDADDCLFERMTETMVGVMEEQNTQMAVCGYVQVDEQGNTKDVLLKGKKSIAVGEMYRDNPQLVRDFLINPPWNKMFVRKMIKRGFDPELSLGEDLLFNLSYLSEIQTVSILEESLYYYFESDTGLGSKYRSDKLEIAERLNQNFVHFCQTKNWDKSMLKEVNHIFLCNVIYGCFDMWISKMDRHECVETIRFWIEKKSVQEAAKTVRMDTKQQKIALFCIRKKWLGGLINLYRLKRLIYHF